METHPVLHFLLPALQTPTVHIPDWQTKVAPGTDGHADPSQSVGSQPYFGSSIATHEPAHSFMAEVQTGIWGVPGLASAVIAVAAPPSPGDPTPPSGPSVPGLLPPLPPLFGVAAGPSSDEASWV